MDKENIENESPVGLSAMSGPSVGHSVEVPSSALTEVGLGQENKDSSDLGASEAVSKSRLKINIRSWSGVAVWKWLANDDTCGICRVAFDGCCPDCKFAGDDCPLVWGECTHCFHIHCIEKWLGTQQTQHQCPMCRQDWKYKE